MHWLERADGGDISSHRLAMSASVRPRWGAFLNACARQVAARAILELSACCGISGAYLAALPWLPRLVTIDGSKSLTPIAEATLAAVTPRATVLCGLFDVRLAEAAAQFAAEGLAIDLVHLDGHHQETATRRYVEMLLPHLAPGALVVVDDIHLNAGMRRAWHDLGSLRGAVASVNAGRCGLILWEGGERTPRRFDVARYTGRW